MKKKRFKKIKKIYWKENLSPIIFGIIVLFLLWLGHLIMVYFSAEAGTLTKFLLGPSLIIILWLVYVVINLLMPDEVYYEEIK